jgi:hypothetical protein
MIRITPVYIERELHVTGVRLGHDAGHLVEFFALATSD